MDWRHDRSRMCGYRGIPCFNARAVKKDSRLHRLCELHRRLHNLTQERYRRRRAFRLDALGEMNISVLTDYTNAQSPSRAAIFDRHLIDPEIAASLSWVGFQPLPHHGSVSGTYNVEVLDHDDAELTAMVTEVLEIVFN